MSISPVLITGSSGFIGRHLLNSLLENGERVRCLVRENSDLSNFPIDKVEIVKGDLTKPKSLLSAASNVKTVYHLAGAMQSVFPRRLYEVNAEGTKNLVQALKISSPRLNKFVYLSSQSAFGPSGSGPVSHYGRSKYFGEEYVRKLAGWSIVRPAAVYGPGDMKFLPLFRMASKGVFLNAFSAGFLTFVHVDDCVRDILSAAPEKILYSYDGKIYSWGNTSAALGGAAGRKLLNIPIPESAIRIGGLAMTAISMISGRSLSVNNDKVREMFAGDWGLPSYENSGYCDIYDGFRDAMKWYFSKDLLR
ncbi:MAG: NAD-dependent epimerase/dehydratase family protein [Elusimicrobia bacterium]|nr:NAD-dependent epimerase/dehydratase family protein [Elusimicrobiota bacterium]